MDINNLGKIGGVGQVEFLGIFVKTGLFFGFVQVRLTDKAMRRYIHSSREPRKQVGCYRPVARKLVGNLWISYASGIEYQASQVRFLVPIRVLCDPLDHSRSIGIGSNAFSLDDPWDSSPYTELSVLPCDSRNHLFPSNHAAPGLDGTAGLLGPTALDVQPLRPHVSSEHRSGSYIHGKPNDGSLRCSCKLFV